MSMSVACLSEMRLRHRAKMRDARSSLASLRRRSARTIRTVRSTWQTPGSRYKADTRCTCDVWASYGCYNEHEHDMNVEHDVSVESTTGPSHAITELQEGTPADRQPGYPPGN